ncbi:MAG: hypothetical protein K8S13_11800 [Desulfobacula sp.]|nr:hypothetical protein [Desulfobacula sp.]MCD4720524.1 hypothetical protein [Desulfobacula sp.]
MMDNFKENRSFHDRRKFTYTAHSPERRSGTDRRKINANKLNVKVA